MTPLELKGLGVIVVYDEKTVESVLQSFNRVMVELFRSFKIVIVANNPNIEEADVFGSNASAEFSGWDEGLSIVDTDEFDVIVFANDTFCTRRPFDAHQMSALRGTLKTASEKSEPFLIGEVCCAIYYDFLLRRRWFLLRWVRTSIFAATPETIRLTQGVGKSQSFLTKNFKKTTSGDIEISENIGLPVAQRIKEWLFPKNPNHGWYKSNIAKPEHLLLKAKCVYQEIDFSYRCFASGVTIMQTNRDNLVKEYLLKKIYRFQWILFR